MKSYTSRPIDSYLSWHWSAKTQSWGHVMCVCTYVGMSSEACKETTWVYAQAAPHQTDSESEKVMLLAYYSRGPVPQYYLIKVWENSYI